MTIIETGSRIHFSLVRFVPDSLRGEVFNVGILGVAEGKLYVRTLGPSSRVHRSLMSTSLLKDLDHLEAAIRERFPQGFPHEEADGTMHETVAPSLGFLRFLAHEGIGGFVIDEPRWREKTSDYPTVDGLMDFLFQRLVEPNQIKSVRHPIQHQRARTVVRQLLSKSGISSLLVPRRVLVRPPYAAEARDFGFAMANGKITLGQTIDFDLKDQKGNTDAAIAVTVEMRELIGENEPCLNIVRLSNRLGPEEEHIRRLQQVGETIVLPRDEDRFLKIIQQSAHREVAEAMREKGFDVVIEGDTIEASK